MLTNVRYILLTALRDWLFTGLVGGVVVAALIAHMLGSTALIETQEMTLSYTAAASRAVIITGLIVFACFHVRNAFDTKEIDVFLSRPIKRGSLVFSYWLGFATVALFLVVPTVAMLALQGLLSKQGFFFWTVSLLVECWLAVAVALFAAFTLKSAVSSVMASLGFYVLARMMGFFIAVTKSAFLFQQLWLNILLTGVIKVVSAIMPRLDFFAKGEWLIYGVRHQQEFNLFMAQACIFIPLLILATIADFQRKQF